VRRSKLKPESLLHVLGYCLFAKVAAMNMTFLIRNQHVSCSIVLNIKPNTGDFRYC